MALLKRFSVVFTRSGLVGLVEGVCCFRRPLFAHLGGGLAGGCGGADPQGRACAWSLCVGRFLDMASALKRLSDIGARFGLSDPRARRSIVAPLVMTQASARPPQSCGG